MSANTKDSECCKENTYFCKCGHSAREHERMKWIGKGSTAKCLKCLCNGYRHSKTLTLKGEWIYA